MRAYTEQENLFDFEQVVCNIEPDEIDLEFPELLARPGMVANTGPESILTTNQIISE